MFVILNEVKDLTFLRFFVALLLRMTKAQKLMYYYLTGKASPVRPLYPRQESKNFCGKDSRKAARTARPQSR